MEQGKPLLLQLSKKTTSQLDHVSTLIKLYAILADLELTENEVTVYAYLVLYGAKPETKELLFQSGILHSKHTYKNMIYKFKKLGLLGEHEKRLHYEIGLEFLKHITPVLGIAVRLDTGILIQLDNN